MMATTEAYLDLKWRYRRPEKTAYILSVIDYLEELALHDKIILKQINRV